MAKILYFGRLTDITQTSAETRDLPKFITTTDGLRKWLDVEHNADGTLLEKTIRIALNNEMVPEPAAVSNADEIAFMPPVGGG